MHIIVDYFPQTTRLYSLHIICFSPFFSYIQGISRRSFLCFSKSSSSTRTLSQVLQAILFTLVPHQPPKWIPPSDQSMVMMTSSPTTLTMSMTRSTRTWTHRRPHLNLLSHSRRLPRTLPPLKLLSGTLSSLVPITTPSFKTLLSRCGTLTP